MDLKKKTTKKTYTIPSIKQDIKTQITEFRKLKGEIKLRKRETKGEQN